MKDNQEQPTGEKFQNINITLDEAQSLLKDLKLLQANLDKPVPRNSKSQSGQTILLKTALQNIGEEKDDMTGGSYTKGDLKSFFNKILLPNIKPIEFENVELLSGSITKDNLKKINSFIENSIKNLENIIKFQQDLSTLGDDISANKIAEIYNNHNGNRDLLIESINDADLKSNVTKMFDTLDKKAKIDPQGIKTIEEKDVKSLEAGKIAAIKDTLKALVNLCVKGITFGYKQGFDRSEYQEKKQFAAAVKTTKEIQKKMPLERAKEHQENKDQPIGHNK